MNNLTSSLEDYLEAIYILNNKGAVSVSGISEFLGVSMPSVNRAVNTLCEMGLLEHKLYGKITLTESGIQTASSVLDRHTIIKKFLSETLNVPDEIAERDACRMEHVMSQQTIQNLYHFLERNTFDEK